MVDVLSGAIFGWLISIRYIATHTREKSSESDEMSVIYLCAFIYMINKNFFLVHI